MTGSSRNLARNSWFTVEITKNPSQAENWQTICLPSVTSSWPKTTGGEPPRTNGTENESKEKKEQEEKKPEAGKVKKIRLFPSKSQRQVLNNWFGTARWTYNQVLAGIKDKEVSFTKKDIRAKYLNEEVFKGTDKEWVLNTPYDLRDDAMIDVLKAYKSNFAKRKKDPQHKFDLKFRSRFAESQAITIHSKHWKRAGLFYPKAWGKEPIKAAEPLPDDLVYDTRIVKDRLGRFYLCQILPLSPVLDHQPEEKVIALDPGVRTFMTGYSPCGTLVECGKGDMKRIFRLCHAHDKLQSKWSQKGTRHRKRYRLKRAARRVRKRIRCLVDEVHKKLAKWLVSGYETILLPKFETSQMVLTKSNRSSDRKSDSKTDADLEPLPVSTTIIEQGERVSLVSGEDLRRAIHVQDMWEMWIHPRESGKQQNL